MPQSSDALKLHSIKLRDGDFDFLSDYYAARGLKASIVIRRLVRAHVDKLMAEQSANMKGTKL